LGTIRVLPDTVRSYTEKDERAEDNLSSSFVISDKSLPTTGSYLIRYVADGHMEYGVITRLMY